MMHEQWNQHLSYLENFLDVLQSERGLAINTITAYRTDLLEFLTYLDQQNLGLSEATVEVLRNYLVWLDQVVNATLSASSRHVSGKKQAIVRPLTVSSHARKLSALRQFFAFLHTAGFLEHNVSLELDLPKKAHLLPKFLLPEEVGRLLQQAEDDSSAFGLRLSCMLEMLYASGLRVSELIGLPISALQYDAEATYKLKNHLTVMGKGSKERIVVLNERALQKLRRYLDEVRPAKSRWLFPSTGNRGMDEPLTRQRFAQMLKQLAVACGMDPDRVSPHIIRHSFASRLLQNGMNLRVLQELLGHSDISTTQIYTHILPERLAATVIAKHPLSRDRQLESFLDETDNDPK